MNLVYKVNDKPKFGQLIVFALQQLLAILAATIAVPSIVGNGMSQSAALFGDDVGTIVYLLFTKFKSPVFLGSSFAFLGSMFAAFGGAASTAVGYAGLVIGAVFAGLVYVIIAILVKVLERMREVDTRELSIPVGTLTGSPLLAGRGPLLTVRMQSVGSPSARFENEFTDAGINQTRHRIMLVVDVSVGILLPGFSTATRVSSEFNVAETVIVGSVPVKTKVFPRKTPSFFFA